jgi:hypothetical protein
MKFRKGIGKINMGNYKVIIDLGELGWALYLSAYCLWLKEHGFDTMVFTYPDRTPLFKDRADYIFCHNEETINKYSGCIQDGTGFRKVDGKDIKKYYQKFVPKGFEIPDDFKLGCFWFFRNQSIYKPYKIENKIEGNKRILIFPRYRRGEDVEYRNLPEGIYQELVQELCGNYPNRIITVCGSKNGTYRLKCSHPNFDDRIGQAETIQDLIDLCGNAIFAMGGTSAPPKISLLQGVPTYIIGHEKYRFTVEENWMKTKVWFDEIKKEDYPNISISGCVGKIMEAVRCL